MLAFILKLVGIIGASVVAYFLATTKISSGPLEETHAFLAVVVELGSLAIIFFS